MKIAYILEVNPYQNSGVVKKINDQISFWKKEGHTIEPYIIWPKSGEESKFLTGEELSNNIINRLPDSFIKTYLTKIASAKILSSKLKSFNPDLVYIRQNIWYPGLIGAIRNYKVILELNSVDFLEMNFYSSLKKRVYLYGKDKILNITSGLIAVTPDILKFYEDYNIPNEVVSNGINLNRFTNIKKVNNLTNSTVNFVFVGSKNMEWHGLDKVFKLAEFFPDYIFNIVGYEKEDFAELNLNNIKFHGWMEKDRLEDLYLKCDFGIGSFSNHFVGKKIDSTLKVREYLAYGLPVILGHHDVDFTNVEFVYKATDDNHNLNDKKNILDFINQYRDYIVSKKDLKKIDSEIKEKQRLDFFLKIIKG